MSSKLVHSERCAFNVDLANHKNAQSSVKTAIPVCMYANTATLQASVAVCSNLQFIQAAFDL